MSITIDDIEKYLFEVKKAIRANRFRVEINDNREDNRDLFEEYVISEEQRKDILLSLTPEDFSEVTPNEHKGYEHELLYVFGKEVNLLRKFGTGEELVKLYIKFNKLENCFVIVISFHKQKYPLKYMFR